MFCLLSNLLSEKVYFVIPGCFSVIIVFILIVFIIIFSFRINFIIDYSVNNDEKGSKIKKSGK